MAVSFKHATQVVGTDAGNGEVGGAEWNAEHSISGTGGTLLGFDASDDAAEIAIGTGLAITTDTLAITADVVLKDAEQTLTQKTLTAPVIDGGYSEEVYVASITGTVALDPANGSIQHLTLTGNVTFTDSLAEGESIAALIYDGTSYTVTMPSGTWVNNNGVAPTLNATGPTGIVISKINSALFFWVSGDGT